MMDLIKEWLGLISLVVGLLSLLYTKLTAGADKAQRDIIEHKKETLLRHEAIVDRLSEHDRRVQTIENEMKHLPSKDAVSDLKLAIADLKGEVGKIGQTAEQAVRAVGRVETFLQKRDA